MAIKDGDFIRLSYTGKVGNNVFDTTDEDEAKKAGIHNQNATYGPVTICVGQKHVILGLDEELVGKKAGSKGTVTVTPEKAFGKRDPKRVRSFPKSQFKEKPVRGMPVRLEEQGEGTVVDVIGSKVIVDFNAPLAGQTLTYEYTIEEIVREPLEQLKGLVRLYSGRDMEMTLDDGKATLILPPGIIYDRRWLLWRGRIIHEGFEMIKGISEIVLVETFKKPEKKEEKSE
ncbi:MAG: putative FKBP-type peptidyl-prolyl cis-trans isomerase [Methanoregula sp. PtaU1.Bin006]|uniref:FKBP-type peptidyl-prolyl cis-trans isomerase n=1 Tax=Methanoregula sp. PtaU1.Bin006 TaxID=1811681 RepID=UPI0009CE3061|nr:peptidylprolyl isomerase [Methanoregula sp. PtaU1.Bin006]OPY37280.1 MAG: putative FKBP-type peptidyl-prolyl cis-trans isomerase [Methanoregula sp. PtaU1.Bin006]